MMRSTAKCLLSALALLVTASVVSEQARSQERAKSEAVFGQLSSLVGEWEGGQDGDPTPIKETYTLIANGSALMVQTKPGDDPVMITMFIVDGDRLIATHYCSARNLSQQ
jgi:hypothetical protein